MSTLNESKHKKLTAPKRTIIETKVCKHCSAIFERKPGLSTKVWRARKYCGKECQGLGRRKSLDKLSKRYNINRRIDFNARASLL